MSARKTKIMAFAGEDPVFSKTVLDDRVLEQVSYFTYKDNKVIMKGLMNFRQFALSLTMIFGKKIKDIRTRMYDVMAISLLLHGCES